jgi:dTDP-4-dehydrorhamnose 3,5-epimerase
MMHPNHKQIQNISDFEGCYVFDSILYEDDRGSFQESFNQQKFEDNISKSVTFVQDNRSKSYLNVLRGLHFQYPSGQGKLVYVLSGEIYDVIVDLRKSSPTFGCWSSIFLSSARKQYLWVPEGFAHGFLSLSHNTEVLYKTTEFWKKSEEYTLMWNDPAINIDWMLKGQVQLSSKDKQGKLFSELPMFD